MNFGNMDIFEILKNANIVVQIDFLILILFSVFSWSIIFNKYFELKRFKLANGEFYKKFVNGTTSLEDFNHSIEHNEDFPLKLVFESGYLEYQHYLNIKDEKKIELKQHFLEFGLFSFSRALVKGQNESLIFIKRSLTTLASIGSISPFIGLFGTVWGIIHSFTGLSHENASLQSVAPGIAEALIATAIGLVAAIPAVWFYNYFDSEIDDIKLEMESFSETFVNKIERTLL